MMLNGTLDAKPGNAPIYAANVCLGAIRVDDQEAKLTVTLTDGSTMVTDAGGVWDYFKDEELRKQVIDIEADQYGYCELANLVLVLCRL